MTRNGVLGSNADLLARAGAILASLPAYALAVETRAKDGGMEATATTHALSRLDAWLDGRPLLTLDVRDGRTTFGVPPGGAGPRLLELRGFRGDQLAASPRP